MSSVIPPNADMMWESRADVIYHFYAYHYFDQGARHSNSLDLINLDDADVQYYNRVADLVRGLDVKHQLAEYLANPKTFILPSAAGNGKFASVANELARKMTMRNYLLFHIALYNLTQEPRRRFYVLGLNTNDLVFAKAVAQFSRHHYGDGTKCIEDLVMATDVCTIDTPTPEGIEINHEVRRAVEKFLAERQETQVKLGDVNN